MTGRRVLLSCWVALGVLESLVLLLDTLLPGYLAMAGLSLLVLSCLRHTPNEDPFVASQKRGASLATHLDNYCTYCHYFVNCDTKHCHYCQKCINGFDHHSLLLNTCLGRQNIRIFVALLACLVLFGLYGLYRILNLYVSPRSVVLLDYQSSQMLLVVLIATNVAKTAFLAAYSAFRVYLHSRGLTQYGFFSMNKVLCEIYESNNPSPERQVSEESVRKKSISLQEESDGCDVSRGEEEESVHQIEVAEKSVQVTETKKVQVKSAQEEEHSTNIKSEVIPKSTHDRPFQQKSVLERKDSQMSVVDNSFVSGNMQELFNQMIIPSQK